MWTIKKKYVPVEAEERCAWLAVANRVAAGDYRSETDSFKRSVLIGLSCFKTEAGFRPALKILKAELEK